MCESTVATAPGYRSVGLVCHADGDAFRIADGPVVFGSHDLCNTSGLQGFRQGLGDEVVITV